MGKRTVKRRIFISNALMVLVTLFILLIINVVFLKAYSEYIEHELEDSIEGVVDEDGLEELLEGYTIRRNEFILLFENVCHTFNEMRGAILAEQEKNRYGPDQIDIQQLTEKGAYQSWIFGPSLLDENGKAKESFLTWSYIRQSHPRTAIGYYEPGHYCLLLVDGRQKSSRGMFLNEMAKVNPKKIYKFR